MGDVASAIRQLRNLGSKMTYPTFADETKPSDRIVEQRLRNRIMEAIWGLSRGVTGVGEAGPVEWFEGFFDHFPYEREPNQFPAMTPYEIAAVREVCRLMQAAIADTAISKYPTVEEITRAGWPQRIAPVAQAALELMIGRGRFSEEVEEAEPSTPVPWP